MNTPASRLIADIVAALSNVSLYATDHPSVMRHVTEAVKKINAAIPPGSEGISFTVLDEILLFNNERVAERSSHIDTFAARLRQRGIDRVVFTSGVTLEEFRWFLLFLSSTDKEPMPMPHIAIGIVELEHEEHGGAKGETPARRMLRQHAAALKDIHGNIRGTRAFDRESIDSVVGGIMSAIERETNVFRALIPFKFHSEYTFAHIINVSVITLFMAGKLGVDKELIRETAMAGLLHDVGKMFIPAEIVDKPGKLDEAEWEQMKAHPVLGARYLASVYDGPTLAMIAAFEHHMKFNGTGYPDTRNHPRKQHMISQIIAVADVFDAIRAERSYKKPMELHAAVGLLESLAGKDFNPLVVETFVSAIKELA